MARRWQEKHDKPLSKEELAAFRDTLIDKDHFGIEHAYDQALNACRIIRGVPAAAYIQKLVTVWKLMRRRAGIRSR